MTPLPKRKLSTQRQGQRRASFSLGNVALVSCSNCHQPARPHTVCQHCGYYNGQQVMTIKSKEKKQLAVSS